MMLCDRNDVAAFCWIVQVVVVSWMYVAGAPSKETNEILSAAACYGNINNYLRLHCPDNKVIRVMKVIQGAKLKNTGCITPATTQTYNRTCCYASDSDCKIEVHDTVSSMCNGNIQCVVMAVWSMVSNQCDQDIYPITITYMQADYTCVHGKFSSPTTITPTTTNITTSQTSQTSQTVPTYDTRTTRPVLEVSTHQQDVGHADIELNDAIIGAILAGSIGMLLTFVVFIIYWRRKRKLRIIGKPQTSVWDYLLSQTFTVRGERGYDHFSSCRSSASSDNGEPKSPVFRKTVWLPNISPVDDAQSDVFNDTDTVHNLEFHQIGTSNPYAFLSLGVNNNSSSSNNDNDNNNVSNNINNRNFTHDA